MTYTPDPDVKVGGVVKNRVTDEEVLSILKDIHMELRQISLCMKVLTDMDNLTADDVNDAC